MTRPKFMSVKMFATHTGLTTDRVYKLAREGKLHMVRLGGSTLVDVEQAMAFLESLPSWREVPTPSFGGSRMPPRWRNRKTQASSLDLLVRGPDASDPNPRPKFLRDHL